MNITSLTLNPPIISKYIFPLRWKFNLKAFWILASLLTIAFLVLYIFQVNLESSERYLIKRYERRLNTILRENQVLEINLIQTNSLDNMMVLMERLNFEKTDKVQYIRVVNNQVVAR